MANYFKLLLLVACVINACQCDFFGPSNIQSVSQRGAVAIQDSYSYMILTNEEFTSDSYLTSVEFYATGPGRIGLSFLSFPSCGKANQQSCQAYMNRNLIGINSWIPWSSLAMIYIEVTQPGYINYQLPNPILVPRGYTPYIIQITTGAVFVPSQTPDLFWAQSSSSNLGQIKSTSGSPLKALIKFNVEPASLSTDTVSYGIPVPTKADANTVLTQVPGYKFYLINAPITYDSQITSFKIFASAPGNITLSTTTLDGCQQDGDASCIDLLVNYQLNSPFWGGLVSSGSGESVTLTLQRGYNCITLPRPLFAQRKSVLTLQQSQGQVALEKVNVPVSDLSDMRSSQGQYTRVSTNPNEAFLVSATAKYYSPPSSDYSGYY